MVEYLPIGTALCWGVAGLVVAAFSGFLAGLAGKGANIALKEDLIPWLISSLLWVVAMAPAVLLAMQAFGQMAQSGAPQAAAPVSGLLLLLFAVVAFFLAPVAASAGSAD